MKKAIHYIVFGLAFLVCQCSLEKPQTPSWNMDLAIPLFNHTYTMTEIVDENDELYADADNLIHFTAEQDIDTIAVGNRLALSDREKSTTLSPPPLPEFMITFKDSIKLDDDILIEEALFRHGTLEIEIINYTNSEIKVDMAFPSFTLNPDTGHFCYHTTLESASESNPSRSINTICLNQATFNPPIVGGQNQVYYNTSISFSENFTAENNVSVRITIKDIILERFRGRFDTFELPLTSKWYKMDLPEELHGITLGPTHGKLLLFNPIEHVPVNIRVSVFAIRDSLKTSSLTYDLWCERTGWNELQLYNIESILNAYPDFVEISGIINVGNPGYGTITEINYNDAYYGRLLIDAGLAFQLPANYENTTSIDTIEIEQDLRDIVEQNLNRAAFIINANNHLPVGAEITFIFSSERADSTLYSESHPSDVIEHFVLKSAHVASENPAFSIQSETSILEFDLSKDELDLFTLPIIYMGTRIKFSGTNGMVKITPTDYIHIKSRIEAAFKTKS